MKNRYVSLIILTILSLLAVLALILFLIADPYTAAMRAVHEINHGAKGDLTLWHTIDNPFGDGIIVFNQQYGDIAFIVIDNEVFAVTEDAYEASGEVEYFEGLEFSNLEPYLNDQEYCDTTNSCKSKNGIAL